MLENLFSRRTIAYIVLTILTALTANYLLNTITTNTTTTTNTSEQSMRLPSSSLVRKAAMSTSTTTSTMSAPTLSHAKIVHRASSTRGSANHGWLNTKHSFSFASWYSPDYTNFGSLRVLNEDRVAPMRGFDTHHHRDAEIFSYILSGELTHRDSMISKNATSDDKDKFYRMKRGDVQFTTGGTGIGHSEQNEHENEWVHFLQIWALPWKRGLPPIYHTQSFEEGDKRKGFVTIITPLKAGPNASRKEEKEAVPTKEGTIPIHADLVFSAGVLEPGKVFEYVVGAESVRALKGRKVYVHLTEGKGKSRVKLDGRADVVLEEGDAGMIEGVNAGDVLRVESVGEEDAEVVVLDSDDGGF